MTDSRGRVPTAVITGAAGGIGSALISAFRDAGYHTIGVDCASAEGVTSLDVSDPAAVTAFAANLETLDVLINAAGVLRLLQEYDPIEFARVVDIGPTFADAVGVKPSERLDGRPLSSAFRNEQ